MLKVIPTRMDIMKIMGIVANIPIITSIQIIHALIFIGKRPYPLLMLALINLAIVISILRLTVVMVVHIAKSAITNITTSILINIDRVLLCNRNWHCVVRDSEHC